ncbi:hypothetical protein CLCR_03752 [Cladophialophora carrionii]|uniref:Uncharacterized protein n=1 Tax=Cladophialophora carrionii TaxID=86049 RepID=A0A1C1CGQ9_9EURO|nr:hypothetical protein CLCR_03752 [Cladophialophora carrionii]
MAQDPWPDMRKTQKFKVPSYDIDRKRLESLLEVLHPPAGSSAPSFRVFRRLDCFVIEAPSRLDEDGPSPAGRISTTNL